MEFLYLREKPYDGILQKFIEPNTESNHVLRIQWSPKICLFERRLNNLPLRGTADAYERAVTYEGPQAFSQTLPLRSGHITQQMLQKANSIACHIGNVTFDTKIVDRMILNFKLDANGTLWFLWCSAMRLRPKQSSQQQVHTEFLEEKFPDFILNSVNAQVQHIVKVTQAKNEEQRKIWLQ